LLKFLILQLLHALAAMAMASPRSGRSTPTGGMRASSPTGQKPASQHRVTQSSPWHEVLELCKKGFAHKLQTLADDICLQVNAEMRSSVVSLKQELSHSMSNYESPIADRMDVVSSKLQELEKQIKTPKVDFEPLYQQLHERHQEQLEAQERLEKRLEEMAKANEDIGMSGSAVLDVLKRLETQVDRLEAKANQSEGKLTQVASNVSSLNAAAQQISKDCQRLQAQEIHIRELVEDQLMVEFGQVKDELRNLDFQEVQDELQNNQTTLETHHRNLLAEISRIQQALQLDFVQVLADKMDKVMGSNNASSAIGLAAQPPQPPQPPKLMLQPDPQQDAVVGHRRDGMVEGSGLNFSKRGKRFREIFSQTDAAPLQESWSQTDPVTFHEEQKEKRKKVETPKPQTPSNVGGADKLKQKAIEASMRPPYSVSDYYWETGYCQRVAKSVIFENTTLFIVFLNAIWIAIDTDNNSAAIIVEADTIFVIVENMFCTYFFSELLIRLCAFKRKLDCFKDFWFVFDLVLVLLMVSETWVIVIIFEATGASVAAGSLDSLKTIRLVKLLRLSRLAKLLQSIPELVIIMKGIKFASRSVSVFFALWLVIIYVFAILFRQLTDQTKVGANYFPSVLAAMNSLMLQGIFPESAAMVNESAEIWYLWPLIVFFLSLVSVTIMYMLVGVLVEVVGVISSVEKESLTVSWVANELRSAFDKGGYTLDGAITKQEFERMMVDPKIGKIVDTVGVDVLILCDMLDMLYEDIEKKGQAGLSFNSLVDTILSMRGSNPATVKDCKEQLRIIKLILNDAMTLVLKTVHNEFENMKIDLADFKDELKEKDSQRPPA